MNRVFRDRREAGRALAEKLGKYAHSQEVIVLGLPRGGVVVAYEVAQELGVYLDIFLVRKLGAPGEPELAMGAIAEGGMLLLNDAVVNYMTVSRDTIELVAREEMAELERRKRLYRSNRPDPEIAGKTVLVVDDGLATGATMRVAARSLRSRNPARLVIAVPVGALSTCMEMKQEADEVVCVITPEPLVAVGGWYENFDQTTDKEVRDLLRAKKGD